MLSRSTRMTSGASATWDLHTAPSAAAAIDPQNEHLTRFSYKSSRIPAVSLRAAFVKQVARHRTWLPAPSPAQLTHAMLELAQPPVHVQLAIVEHPLQVQVLEPATAAQRHVDLPWRECSA